jgi:hypothetical protein
MMIAMARCDADYKSEVLLTCYDALSRRGFTRYRKADVDWPFDNDFHGWVGLNTGLYDEYVEVNPFMGIHATSIDRLCARIRKTKYDRGVATYAVHLGEVAPDEKVFRITRHTNVKAEAERLADLCVAKGIPFAKSLATYEALLPRLRSRVARLGGYPERVACCLFLAGRLEDAHSFVDEFLPSHEKYFQPFAVSFLEFLRQHA